MAKYNQPAAPKTFSALNVFFLLIAIIGCCIGGYYFWNNSKSNAATPHNQQPINPPPVFLTLPALTVSLSPDEKQPGYDTVLYLGITLRLYSEKEKEIINLYMPEVRSRTLLLLSQYTASALMSDTGKAQLAEKLKTELSQPYSREQNKITIDDILFTDFILR